MKTHRQLIFPIFLVFLLSFIFLGWPYPHNGICSNYSYSQEHELGWDTVLSVMPVTFAGKSTTAEGDLLESYWSEQFFRQQFYFLLPKVNNCRFFKHDKDKIVRISQERFFKEYKEKIWIVYYIPGETNIAYSFSQIPGSANLPDYSFINDVDPGIGSRHGAQLWSDFRLQVVVAYNIMDNLDGTKRMIWLLLKKVDSHEKSDFEEIDLADNFKITRGLRLGDKTLARIVDNGFFIIHKKTVFTTIEKNLGAGHLGRTDNQEGAIKTKLLDIDYFYKNYRLTFCMCIYDTASKTVLQIAILQSDPNRT